MKIATWLVSCMQSCSLSIEQWEAAPSKSNQTRFIFLGGGSFSFLKIIYFRKPISSSLCITVLHLFILISGRMDGVAFLINLYLSLSLSTMSSSGSVGFNNLLYIFKVACPSPGVCSVYRPVEKLKSFILFYFFLFQLCLLFHFIFFWSAFWPCWYSVWRVWLCLFQ